MSLPGTFAAFRARRMRYIVLRLSRMFPGVMSSSSLVPWPTPAIGRYFALLRRSVADRPERTRPWRWCGTAGPFLPVRPSGSAPIRPHRRDDRRRGFQRTAERRRVGRGRHRRFRHRRHQPVSPGEKGVPGEVQEVGPRPDRRGKRSREHLPLSLSLFGPSAVLEPIRKRQAREAVLGRLAQPSEPVPPAHDPLRIDGEECRSLDAHLRAGDAAIALAPVAQHASGQGEDAQRRQVELLAACWPVSLVQGKLYLLEVHLVHVSRRGPAEAAQGLPRRLLVDVGVQASQHFGNHGASVETVRRGGHSIVSLSSASSSVIEYATMHTPPRSRTCAMNAASAGVTLFFPHLSSTVRNRPSGNTAKMSPDPGVPKRINPPEGVGIPPVLFRQANAPRIASSCKDGLIRSVSVGLRMLIASSPPRLASPAPPPP